MNISFSPRQVLKTLLVFIVLLILFSSLANTLKLTMDNGYTDFFHRLFNVDYENNIPTFYSALALFLSAVLLLIISFQNYKHKTQIWPWFILGIIFMFLCIDETSQIHEKLIRSLRYRWGLQGYFYNGWIIPYGIAAIAIFLTYLRFLISLPKKTRNYMLLSGFIFILGSVVMEMISVDIGFAHTRNDKSAAYLITMTLEEMLEMVGIALFIYTLLDYISTKYGYLGIKVSNKEDSRDSSISN